MSSTTVRHLVRPLPLFVPLIAAVVVLIVMLVLHTTGTALIVAILVVCALNIAWGVTGQILRR